MQPVILIVLDGFGLRKEKRGNAVKTANTPNLDSFMKTYPNSKLKAWGEFVGLPKGAMGGSEVGHLTIGAGRTVNQELTRISKSIKDKSFFKNKTLLKAIEHVKKNNSALHLMGLLSDAGVHSHIDHLFALLKLAKMHNVEKVFVHAFLDGRDTPPKSALKYIKQTEKKLKSYNKNWQIETIMGRYYAMDRDNRWNREHKAYDALVNAKGYHYKTATEALREAYKRGESDEFVKPSIIGNPDSQKQGDAVVFFNFRSDRARQLTKAFVKGDFNNFKREQLTNLYFVTLTQYEKAVNTKVAFPPKKVKNTLGEVISKHKLNQLRIAETEKWAHVTFFFNGLSDRKFKNEDRKLIPSPKITTYNLKPEMSALEVCNQVIHEIHSGWYDFILLNFANPDMVGHTGDFNATVKALEVIDSCLGKIKRAIDHHNGKMIITADHGNCEDMKGDYQTSHSFNPVPFMILKKGFKLKNGTLADIAPTILKLMDIKKPKEMKGKSLIK